MILPFVVESLFKINPNFKVTLDEYVIIIDNWYLNYEDLLC